MLGASQGTLAFSATSLSRTTRLMSAARDGSDVRTLSESESYSWPRLSPDGTRLVLQRVDGRRGTPDLALCLAVVHHVCITGNVPVREFLDWLRSLDTALVIEFPDREDPMVQRLLSGKREGSNPDYDAAVFESALAERFTIDQKSPVSETRTLFEARPLA